MTMMTEGRTFSRRIPMLGATMLVLMSTSIFSWYNGNMLHATVPWSKMPTRRLPPHARYNNTRNTADTTSASFSVLLSSYVEVLDKVRNESLENNSSSGGWRAVRDIQSVVNSYDEDYFITLQKFSKVRTSVLSATLDDMRKHMLKDYFSYSTNDCNYVEMRSNYGRHWGKGAYNAECRESIEFTALTPHPVQGVATSVGLPPKLNLADHRLKNATAKLHIVPCCQMASRDNEIDLPISYALTFIHVVEYGVALTNGDVISSDLKLVSQRCKSSSPSITNTVALKMPIYDEVFSISQYWGSGFYHGTIENLPRIAPYVDFLKRHPNIVVLAASIHPFLVQLLGIPTNRIVSGNVRGRIVYMPAGGTCGRSSLFTTQSLSLQLRQQIAQTLPDPLVLAKRNNIVLIRRSHKRFFSHHEAILKMLRKHAANRGLSVVVYGDNPIPGVKDTGEIFGRAMMVVAPHGAGESNVVFSSPGTILVEGLCYEGTVANLCYRNLAQVLGLRYFSVLYGKQCMGVTANDLEPYIVRYLNLYDKGKLK